MDQIDGKIEEKNKKDFEQSVLADNLFANRYNHTLHALIDITDDLVAGTLLGRIMYWFSPSKDGTTRAKIERYGNLWIAKKRTDWFEEIRITPKQYDRAITVLINKNLVICKKYKFNGMPTIHIRLNYPVLCQAIENWKKCTMQGVNYSTFVSKNEEKDEEKNMPSSQQPQGLEPQSNKQGGKRELPKGKNGNCPKGKNYNNNNITNKQLQQNVVNKIMFFVEQHPKLNINIKTLLNNFDPAVVLEQLNNLLSTNIDKINNINAYLFSACQNQYVVIPKVKTTTVNPVPLTLDEQAQKDCLKPI